MPIFIRLERVNIGGLYFAEANDKRKNAVTYADLSDGTNTLRVTFPGVPFKQLEEYSAIPIGIEARVVARKLNQGQIIELHDVKFVDSLGILKMMREAKERETKGS